MTLPSDSSPSLLLGISVAITTDGYLLLGQRSSDLTEQGPLSAFIPGILWNLQVFSLTSWVSDLASLPLLSSLAP